MAPIRSRPWHALLGTVPDKEVAHRAGISLTAVKKARRKLGVGSFRAAGGLRRSCSIPDCKGPRYGQGFCEDHYYRSRFYGDPLHSRERKRSGSTVGHDHKVCTGCGQDKLMTLFGVSAESLDGRTSRCLDCGNRASAVRQRRSKSFVNGFKNEPCSDCGRKFPSFCMDFDHVRGQKIKNVSAMASTAYSQEAISAEVAKCDLVCACCHRIRTKMRISAPTTTQRQEFLARLSQLKSSPCTDCGELFPAEAMDFDHVRGTKLHGVATMMSHPWDSVLAEVSKCDLVCACCHRIRTEARRPAPKYDLGVQDAVL